MNDPTPRSSAGEDLTRPDVPPGLAAEAAEVADLGLRLGVAAREWAARYTALQAALEVAVNPGDTVDPDWSEIHERIGLDWAFRGAATAYHAVVDATGGLPFREQALDDRVLAALVGGVAPGRPCGCELAQRAPDVHASLTTFERDGVPGVLRLLEHLDEHENLEGVVGLRWFELADWAAEHRWSDQLAVIRLAQIVTFLCRAAYPPEVPARVS